MFIMEIVSVGQLILKRRNELKISSIDLAHELGITPAAVTLWERNPSQRPTMQNLTRIIEILKPDNPAEWYKAAGYPVNEPFNKSEIIKDLEEVQMRLNLIINKIRSL